MVTFAEFSRDFEEKKSAPDKIRTALAYMRSALSAEETPQFKPFWECRKRALPLFKEVTALEEKKALWEEYVLLGSEAKQLKKLCEEKAAFVGEQIALAIFGVESDLDKMPALLEGMEVPPLPESCRAIKERRAEYIAGQKEVVLLGTLADRLQALRLEVLALEMRHRQKNQLLDRIRTTGDRVFPKKKEVVERLSKSFMEDVEQFAQEQEPDAFALKQEIKDLQQIAKLLPLNRKAYVRVREVLEAHWEALKKREKRAPKGRRRTPQEAKRQESALAITHALQELLDESPAWEAMAQKQEELQKRAEELNLSPLERESVNALLRRVAGSIAEKKAIALFSEEGADTPKQLLALLGEREERRKAIKEEMQRYRKLLGGSNLDFAAAMHYRELLDAEREALEQLEDSITALEQELEKHT